MVIQAVAWSTTHQQFCFCRNSGTRFLLGVASKNSRQVPRPFVAAMGIRQQTHFPHLASTGSRFKQCGHGQRTPPPAAAKTTSAQQLCCSMATKARFSTVKRGGGDWHMPCFIKLRPTTLNVEKMCLNDQA
jgi:hypothetical protein